MINEEARADPAPSEDGIFGSSGGARGENGASSGVESEMDYSKPFRLFDEQGLGVIPVDQFRTMLYRLHVNSLLRERQVVALIDRFDVERTGENGSNGHRRSMLSTRFSFRRYHYSQSHLNHDHAQALHRKPV